MRFNPTEAAAAGETALAGPSAAAAWSRWRDEFPVTAQLIYLNHAAVSPLCRRAATAMKSLADDACGLGSFHYDRWLDAYQGLRVAAARLLGANSSEIAIVKNTSEGISTVALGIDWRPGDIVVGFEEEFPANYYPWERLARRGVQLRWLSVDDPLDRIDEACRGARLLTISFVQYLSGFRADLKAIGEICTRRGCFFFVDAIQGLGAFPLDVNACRIDALAADGHKWLMGPEGCGILYIRRDRQDEIDPTEFGYTNVAAGSDYGRRDMTLRNDAARYEPGTLNTIGIYGLRAAIEFVLEVGVDAISREVLDRSRALSETLGAAGCELLRPWTPAHGSGILACRAPGVDAKQTVAHLRETRIAAAARSGWVRLSPHFYISPAEVETAAGMVRGTH